MLERMFAHQGKMARRIGPERVNGYAELHRYLSQKVQRGQLPSHPDYLGGNELATNIYQRKYYLKDLEGNLIERRPEDVFVRLAAFMAAIEPEKAKRRQWAEAFYRLLYEGRFIPGGRVIAGAGDLYRVKTLANCFVTQIAEDSIEAIYQAAYECARTYSFGGGIGVDVSPLRPKDSVVHNAADRSTGAVSFMELFSLTTGLIGQSGRRGALMITLDVKHPDVLDFIRVKKIPNWVTRQIVEQCQWTGLFSERQLREIERQVMENTQVRFANISIKVSDEFMQAVDEQTRYGPQALLVYRKLTRSTLRQAYQGPELHYASGIPSKDIRAYELWRVFEDLEALNRFLSQEGLPKLDEALLRDPSQRDVFGDYVIELPERAYDLAIRYGGDFLLYFGSEPTGEIRRLVKARDIWDAFVEGNYRTAEPGLIFWSTMVRYSPSNYVGRPISCTNPCAEVPLEDGGACNLGSLNLSRFVRNGYRPDAAIEWDRLWEATQEAVRFLDNVVSWNEVLNPLEKQRRAAAETRRLGLGVMGIADMLNQLGIGYDSPAALELLEQVMAHIANAAYQASAKLAAEKGPSPLFAFDCYSQGPFFQEALWPETQALIRQHGLRNIALLSIAPTGTISNIVLAFEHEGRHYIGVSGGIEPIFALYYTRRSESFGNQFFRVFHSTVQAYLDMHGLSERAQHVDLAELLPEHFLRTAHHIDPSMRVRIQAICQRYIDHSISSTVNLPEDIEPEVISNIYLEAWRNGLKGITVYRDGSRYPILSVDGKKTRFQEIKDKRFRIRLADGTTLEAAGDEVVRLPNGRLTTVYHLLERRQQSGSPQLESLPDVRLHQN
ncbi:MAG: adenosylcobalamin-dependent ribonucleoside-diphosphate reductase [Bacteroidetes bacterium]|nr:adenosylcobalamin-dependent ribonucleoside-diphosphate reductase [Rhodothermia bacterium]MCS7155823.1 adenosylcobalamin-dependent ribonucleoside-diphosphate reductase [Bacteroidota bacterium]MCX7906076.1 adenosylcobalamin-dependent ribonucleoside-diphosphate reductase [Bacteroidota bacterium]MDW8138204.1 adenosylcobalamin-dependent ribonucleoside-diphosphate reductase [Bacteroidota bacterium]MDW8285888.1 adenosylcobalamin-dependent ribonucleoside-diphosphate reductase [Bacteroidota bacterium